MPDENLLGEILDRVEKVKAHYEKLVLLVGPHSSGKTSVLLAIGRQVGYPYRSVGLEVSRQLLDVPARQRSHEVRKIVGAIVDGGNSDVVLLDNLEVLFDPSLAANPLNLLRSLSRNRVLVAAWAGSVDGAYLNYAAPGHREYRRYAIEDSLVLPL